MPAPKATGGDSLPALSQRGPPCGELPAASTALGLLGIPALLISRQSRPSGRIGQVVGEPQEGVEGFHGPALWRAAGAESRRESWTRRAGSLPAEGIAFVDGHFPIATADRYLPKCVFHQQFDINRSFSPRPTVGRRVHTS